MMRIKTLKDPGAPGGGATLAGLAGLLLLAACGDGSNPAAPPTARSPDVIPADALRVNSTEDAVDAAPGDGRCASSTGACTLRAAVMEANASGVNASGARHTIWIPAGHYRLDIPNAASTGAIDNDSVPDRPLRSVDEAGSLLLEVPMRLQGAGARDTIIDANRIDRVFEVGQNADSVLSDLTITGGAGNTLGGGVYAQALARLERVIVRDNEASGGGGIFINPFGTLELIDSTVSQNQSANQAGGIRIDSRGLIVNSTISHNRANGPVSPLPAGTGPAPLLGKGGGVDVRGTAVTIINSTIAHNSADAGGAGLHFAYAYTDSLPDPLTDQVPSRQAETLLINTIIVHNESQVGPADCLAEVPSSRLRSLGGNLDSDGSCGLDAVLDRPSRDPQLGPLQDNGGSTDTHALPPGSAARDAGVLVHCSPTDQRGVPRGAGGACDSGAFELP